MKAEAVVTTSLAIAMLLTAAMSLHARLIPSPVQRGRARVGATPPPVHKCNP